MTTTPTPSPPPGTPPPVPAPPPRPGSGVPDDRSSNVGEEDPGSADDVTLAP